MGDQGAQQGPAEATLFNEVYAPAFVEKCASLGMPLADSESLATALETAGKLKELAQTQSGSSGR